MERRYQLVRPSELARYWGLHPKTLYLWVRTGKLAAVRTPGGQYRIDPDAIRSLARKHALPLPPFVKSTDRRVMVIESARAVLAALRRECSGLPISIEAYRDGYEALVAAAVSPPELIVLPLSCDGFDPLRAVRALASLKMPERPAFLAFGAATVADEHAARRAGATQVVRGGGGRSLAREVTTLLGRIDRTKSTRKRALPG